ncbi:hypothetical protein CW357_18140 [Rummeliibacillus sp. TYF005]|nr:hypothetical protein CW357_18140 [Rummeliibacillus sp. TYF005]
MNRRNAEKRLFDTPVKKSTSKDSPQVGTNTYYTTNPGKVKLLASCNLYTSVEFNDKTKSGLSYPKGTVFTVNGIKKSKNGVPRLIVSNGKFVLTANKEYVKKV